MRNFKALVCVLFCVLITITQTIFAADYEFEIPPEYQPQITNIFPGAVDAQGWKNPAESVVQDISEYALFDAFDSANSATLDRLVEAPSPVESEIVSPQINTSSSSQDTTTDDGSAPLPVVSEQPDGSSSAGTSEDENQTTPGTSGESPSEEEAPIPQDSSEEESPAQESSAEAPVSVSESVSTTVLGLVKNVYLFAVGMLASSSLESSADVLNENVEEVVATTEPVEQTVTATTTPLNSATGTTTEAVTPEGESQPVEGEPSPLCVEIHCFNHTIEFSDFNVGEGFEEQKILNIQLRMSLGAQPHAESELENELIRIEYFHDDAWIQGGEILLTDEISNAINGGYYLFAFPLYDQWDQLAGVKVRVSYGSDNENLAKIYLDSVWLEVESIDNNALNEREPAPIGPITEKPLRQNAPEGYTLDLQTKDAHFAIDENPKLFFTLQKEKRERGFFGRMGQRIRGLFGFEEEREERPRIRVVNEELRSFAKIVETGEGTFELDIKKARQFRPGKHIVTIEVTDENGTFFIDQEFMWGVLALNSDKTIYAPSEEAHLMMGVLDDTGHTICDAKLQLEITAPDGGTGNLSTEDGSIEYGEECAGDTYITTPDYEAHYRIGTELGAYSMKLTATTENGVRTVTDVFEVRESVPFDVTREGPTRIYPPELYPVKLTITANEEYVGPIIEYVPVSFQVYESDDSFTTFSTYEEGDAKQLIWNVSMEAGETVELEYLFKAPDISPEFYLLGPLQIASFKEIREWQIASDAPDRAVIRQSVVGSVADATTYTATLPSAPVIGNTIIMVALHRDDAVSFNVPAGGFTEAVYSDSANFIDVGIWYKVATNTTATYSITKNGGGNESGLISLFEVSGLDTTDLLDVVSENDQTSTNSRVSFTGASPTSAQYGFAIAASGWGDDDFTNPTTASWTSSSTDAYTQRSWTEWATSNAGSLGIATAFIDSASVQGARLTVTGGGGTEDRNSVVAVFNLVPQVTTVGSRGNQTAQLKINTNNNYVGGAFTLLPNSGTTTVTSINIVETGTVNAQNDLSSIKLRYEMDTTNPYDCASVSYGGTEAQYGATSTSFSAANGTSTFNGSVTIASTSAMCVYPVLNVDSSATDGQTLELQITNPSLRVSVGGGTVSPTSAVTLSGTSEISIGYTPSAPLFADTPAFESYRATSTGPRLGGFASTDVDGDLLQYAITIDDDFDFSSPATTTYSFNYPNDAGWASSTFAQGATTTYRFQTNNALTVGETYWYVVRARDPFNSNDWSASSTPRSITISSSITVPEWYQTTDEQFATRTTSLINATTTGNDSVTINSIDNPVSLLNAWSLGTTKAISAGTDRVLIIAIHVEDAGTDNVNTVTYGGQTVTQIYDQTVGAGFSDSLWVGYLNEAGIALASNTTITPTWTPGTPVAGDVIYHSAVFQHVNQSNPVRGYSSNALTTGANIAPTASSTVVDGDMSFYAVAAGDTVTFTPSTGYTEGTDNSTCTDGCASATAYKAITSNGTELPTATLSGSANRVLITEVVLASASPEAEILSMPVDFDWVGNQNDWGEVSWSVTEPTGTDSVMQLYYGASCSTIVPNGALTGNSTGFSATSSPLNISGLSTSTYNQICLKVTLDRGSGTESPSLNSWAISWVRKPVFTQESFRWYVNANSITPSDPWPSGATDLAQNAVMTATDPIKTDEIIRLRHGLGVSSVSATGNSFKLQYAEGDTCSATLSWIDVGAIGSTTALWRGYNNATPADGATLPSGLLTATDQLETYEEENSSATMPNAISTSQSGEWDWVLQNKALPGTSYCFRMTENDGTPLTAYSVYPRAVTNFAPSIILFDEPFDNEKVSTTSPSFEFYASDSEGNEVDYEVQVDNDNDFSSTIIDTDSEFNLDDFLNVDTPADKSPFNHNERIRYTISSALTNGNTYWWRVRSKDVGGSKAWSDWTVPHSFTIDTSVTISTWFQTTEEQFDTDTLISTDATASDLVTMVGIGVGTTTSSAIDFDEADTGNAWGTLSWNDNETTGDIKYHVEYYTGSAWARIPDSDLAGNATGFDTSPIVLIDLDTETYNQIRITANFTYGGGSPTLSDWTVSWGERVSVVTHLSLFDNEKVGTTSPTFTFTTTDPQGQNLQYQISYSTDSTFVTGTTTRTSNVSPGFTNLTNGADTDPFNSGDTISYKIQTPLTNGTTYWWRVRAKDPGGSDSYSFWSDPWSFTVDTSVVVSTWFQTTQEQFETDSLTGVVASTSDQLRMLPPGVTTYTFAGITNPSATHVGRDFEVDVDDPTDPPTIDAINTLTNSGLTSGTPNLRSGIAGYASDAEATNAQYTQLSTSDNSRWQITDPGITDQAVFWARFHINESAADIDQIDILLEGYQNAATDVAWLGIWRPGAATPYWQDLSHSQRTGDFNYTGSITTNIDEYLDGSNNIHIIFFNEDDDDSLFVDYVEVEVTSAASTEGTAYGAPVDYNDGSGPAWGAMAWNDSTPGSSNILYQLQYLNALDVWTLIPDGALSGNSSGFTTSPIDLQTLNTTTYNEVRMVGNFDCVGINCPSMNDWTLSWSEGFDISGTAHEYNGTASTTSGTVAVAVNGVLQIGKTGTILANGTWTIDNVTFYSGDTLTVFVSGANDADEAIAVANYDGTPGVSGMRIQKRHLTLGSADNQIITNVDIGEYDFTDDEDLFFDVDGINDLDMCATTGCSDAGLVIRTSNTYTPGTGADAIVHDFRNDGTYIPGSSTLRLSGSFDNNATTTMTGSEVIFTATSTTESIDQTGAPTTSFNNVTFGEGSGTATWNLVTTLDVNGNLAVTYGTLARASLPVTIGGNLTTSANGFWSTLGTTTFDGVGVSLWTDSNTTKQNIGSVVVDGTTKTLRLGSDVVAKSMNIGADDSFDLSSSNFDITIYRNWINGNTFDARQGTVFFAATTSNRVITAGGDNFFDISFSGSGGSWAFTESTLGVSNDFTISSGIVTMPTATTTIAGSFTNSGGTFSHNNGQLYFTSGSSETLTLGGTTFTNAFYNVRFTGAGSWAFTEAQATTSNTFRITQGNVTMPSGTLTLGDSFINSGGTFSHNNGVLKFISSGSETIDTNSSFNTLQFTGSGSQSFVDSNVTVLDDLTVSGGALTLPSGTLTLGGSLSNTATLTHNNGTVLFNSSDGGETINPGSSSLYNMTFNSATGGWTINQSATSTNNVTLTSLSSFTLASGRALSVGAIFTNSVGGASTTWTGSTLSLEAGNYSLNTKTNVGDSYNNLRVDANTDIKMWNSSASAYLVNATGSLYSQDHSGADGDLYIFGNYPRSSGTEYWSYGVDFDGTTLSTTSRQVDVRFASGASASFTNATLNATGISTATTTIANQGAGTYVIGISGGTTTASYYDFRNLGSTGISLSNANHLNSLGYGFLSPGVGGGTTLTVSSTTIDANPGEQIYNVNFSTTSAVVATNVTQVDGAPTSYWWFRNSRGNIDGESFDFDSGNPGTIRWDDSSLLVNISGVVYTDDGTTPLVGGTCNGVATPVRLVVEGGFSYSQTCSNVNGSFNFTGVAIVGDPTLTLYLDGASGGERAVTLTKTVTADVSGLDLYANRVITRHEDVAPFTIEDMVFDSTNDTDIFFTSATGTTDTLVVAPNRALYVWATSTFTPGGIVTLNSGGSGASYDGSLYIANSATFIASSSASTTIGGSFVMDVGGSFVHGTGTVLMSATTTGKTISVPTGEEVAFNILRFTGVGGGWNLSGNIRALDDIHVSTGTLTGTGNITIPNGSFYGNGLVSLGSGTTTIERINTLGGSQGWTFYNLALGNGSVVGTTTPASVATTTIGGKLTIRTAHYLDAGSSHFDFSGTGTVFLESGTFLEDTSTVRYSGGGATNIRSTAYYNLDLNAGAGSPTYTATGLGINVLNNLTIGGESTTAVDFNTNDSALDVNGNVTIRSNGTLSGSNSGAFTLAGNYDNDGTFTANGGTLTFDGGVSSNIMAGNSSFGNVTISGAGSFTVSENATTTGAWNLTNAGSFTLSSGQTLAVGGVFTNGIGGAQTTWTGSTLKLFSGTNYQINTKSITDAYATLVVGANTDIRMWNSSAGTYTVNSTGSLYSQDHSDVAGDLYIYGAYPGNGGTDYWSYARDFDGTVLGGSARGVDVRFASGASADILSGGLQVLGDTTASTSLQNQGSGTYSIHVGGSASTTWTYYDIEDTNTSGLTFSGTPNVITLSRGDFEISQNGGSGITVGGSVITANPAKTFTNNIFASTSAISAYNVTATGTTVSSWRFTNHSGNLAGEAKDNDPDGDPGYLVWDNSAANISISGNVYSDEGSSISTVCDSSTNNIHLRVAGLTSYTTSCNGDGFGGGTGAYLISGITFSPGDSLVLYIDGESEKAAVVTEDPVSNISNMHLYENRVIVRHESTDPLSIADMAIYDSGDDGDIPFTAVDAGTDTLTLPANRKLLIWTGKEFAPSGNVTLSGGGGGASYDGTLEAQTSAVLTFAGGQSHSVGGSFILGNSATFEPGQSTTTFTTSGSGRTIDTNNEGFYDTAFTGSGSWSVTDANLTLRNFTMTGGTLTLPSGTTTISGSWNNNGGSFNVNSSPFVFTATDAGNIVRGGGSSFDEMYFNGAGGSWSMTDGNATSTNSVLVNAGTLSLPSGIFSIAGNFRNEGGSLAHNTSELVLRSSSPATLKASSSDLYAVTFNGSGGFTFLDEDISLLDDLRILQGSVTFASGTLSVGGSFAVSGGSFSHSSGTVLFNSTDTGETINPSSSNFYNAVFSGVGGGWTITASATTTNNFSLTTATSFTQQSGTRLSVGGVFNNTVGGSATVWTGSTLALTSGTTYEINTKLLGADNYQTLIIGANTDISSWNSRATTTSVNASGSLYSQDHGNSDGALYIFGDYHITTGSKYWSYATDFDGTALGGSPRTVMVSIAGGATTTVDGGTLNMLGASGNTTTITNQGSGTYDFNVSSGTFNAQHYRFRNLNSNGLTFSGAPSISSLSNGDFELAVNGGSLITLSTTTLNANASMVFSGNNFATTTAITGTNITLLGTTSNAWTFESHTGNLDGEAYDSDGVSACGSLRWSDSACLLTQETHFRWRNDDGGVGAPNTEWFNASWDARKSIRLQNADAISYTNAVVKVDVAFDSNMQANFADIRFTDDSGTTTIPHFIDRYTASTDADVWVKLPFLATSSVATIFMYYDNGTASSTSSSTRTFLVADDFEDGNKTEYSGDTSLFTVDGSFAYGGSYGLDATGHEGDKATDGIARFDTTLNQGEVIRYLQYVDTGVGSVDEVCTLFGVQSPVTVNQNYAVCLEQYGVDRISLARDVDNTDISGVVLASTTVSFATGWYEVEIDWQTDDDIFVELSKDGTLIATTSDNDGTYTSGGAGFTFWFQNGGWDNYTSRPRLNTEPTASFGAEQIDGGASWKADVDTPASYMAGDKARVRFAVENTGAQITNQTFDIEYAAIGAAPSCQAVSGASYATVPLSASCGSSPICMATSTFLSNNESISDLLFGPELDFMVGKAVEDPSFTTSALSLNQDEYTELEYVLTPTVNATDSAYCMRLSDGGDPLDTYLKVAELQLQFDPIVTNVSINSGADITLVPGATTTVYATGTATDLNGYTDLISATSTMYRSGVAGGAGCSANNNDCYISAAAPECTFTSCSGNSCTVSCSADFYYHADATDATPYIGEEWLASIEVVDSNGVIDINTSPSGVEVITLHALDVTSAISYGSLAVSSTTGSFNPTTTVQNLGNRPIDINVEGSDLSDGGASIIPAYEQHFSTTTFTYTGCVGCSVLSSTSVTTLEVDLTKPTNTTPITDIVYWGIEIPFGVASNPHSGTNIFYAIGD